METEAHAYGNTSPPLYLLWGPEEDIGHMRLLCARDEEVAGLLCRRVEEFTAELPPMDRAVDFVAWREHGCRWIESLMARVVPGDLKRLFAAVRAASSRGPAKARLFVEDMFQIGEDVYARRNQSAHPDHAAADARSKESGIRVPAR